MVYTLGITNKDYKAWALEIQNRLLNKVKEIIFGTCSDSAKFVCIKIVILLQQNINYVQEFNFIAISMSKIRNSRIDLL